MNKVFLLGNMASDVEIRTTQSGKSVASFRIAVSRRGSDEADFIPCVAWERTADNIERWFPKGRRIAILGRWQARQYEDKSGKTQTAHECVVDEFDFCQKRDYDDVLPV